MAVTLTVSIIPGATVSVKVRRLMNDRSALGVGPSNGSPVVRRADKDLSKSMSKTSLLMMLRQLQSSQCREERFPDPKRAEGLFLAILTAEEMVKSEILKRRRTHVRAI